MKRFVIAAIALIILSATSSVLFQLVTEPKDIDVSDCTTQWEKGRISSVVCPGGPSI